MTDPAAKTSPAAPAPDAPTSNAGPNAVPAGQDAAENGGPNVVLLVALGLALVVAIGFVGYRLAASQDSVDTTASGDASSDQPGAAVPDDGSGATADQSLPALVSSQPADGEVEVDLETDFLFRFDKAIADPTDVVVEIRNRGVVAPAAVDRSSIAFDPAGGALSFVLDRPMVPETAYSMAVLGLRSLDGTAMRPLEITFTTTSVGAADTTG